MNKYFRIFIKIKVLYLKGQGAAGRSIGRTFHIVFKFPNYEDKLKIATKNKGGTKIEVFLKDC